MKKIKLSDEFYFWRGTYSGFYPLEDFISAVNINKSISIPSNLNSLWVEVNLEPFVSVNEQVKQFLSSEYEREFKNYAEHYWVYTQKKDYNQDWMHQHLNIHPGSRSKAKTDFTFTYYIKQLDNLQKDEGKIIFKTEDGVEHKFLPKTDEIFIFPGNLWHKAVPTPNHDEERIVYAGSLAFNVLSPPCFKKPNF